ncbi:MAG: hypothetical protein M1825_002796 [Sarcosagium campestre]|nr:MAG: hypothetical protein M1825_002796 [Sarcosagium campestre]
MEELLTPIKTSTTSTYVPENELVRNTTNHKATESKAQLKEDIRNGEDAIRVLQSKPDLALFSRVLLFLVSSEYQEKPNARSNIRHPSPISAQLISVLVETSLPDFWAILKSSRSKKNLQRNDVSSNIKIRSALLRCLSGISGTQAIVARLRRLIALDSEIQKTAEGPSYAHHISILLDFCQAMFEDENFVLNVYVDAENIGAAAGGQQILWTDFCTLLCSGRLLSVLSEAAMVAKRSSGDVGPEYWFVDGSKFSSWLGRNITNLISKLQDDSTGWGLLSRFVGRSFSLGYADDVVGELYSRILLQEPPRWQSIRPLLANFRYHERRIFLHSILRRLARNELNSPASKSEPGSWWHSDSTVVGAAAALIKNRVVEGHEDMKDCLCSWLTDSSGGSIAEDIGIRRAVVAALAYHQDRLKLVLEKSLSQFGDSLSIKHTPILLQEVNTQVLLLSAGYAHRTDPATLATLARSSTYLNAISNRLAASSPRSHFLGMVVGLAVSKLVDKPDKRMKFSLEELEGPESQWYQSLTGVDDPLGDVTNLERNLATVVSAAAKTQKVRKHNGTHSQGKHPSQTSKIISIQEVTKSSPPDTDDDLIAYEKPDTDEEDEDEDPTTIQRDKPSAPVYILDLINGLRDDENFDRHRLALSAAAGLIQRKAHFGTEVSDNTEELASVLAGLHDKFEMDQFDEMRQHATIALVAAQPEKIGPWLARSFFEGDYSLSQRGSMLIALGLGARTLAGHSSSLAASSTSLSSFPSKTLPPRLHSIYSDKDEKTNLALARSKQSKGKGRSNNSSQLSSITAQLSQTLLEPLALTAADSLTGPDALKIRTFSSRMSVERKRAPPSANALAPLVGPYFFFPLTARFAAQLSASGGNGGVYLSPHLLPTFIRTLVVIVHAAGASAPVLPQVTSEMWDLLLAVRVHAVGEAPVLEAVLLALLTLLDLNAGRYRQLAEEHARELHETMAWVQQVFDGLRGGGSGGGVGGWGKDDEGERARTLAAGVLVRGREVVEKYQRVLMGEGVSF